MHSCDPTDSIEALEEREANNSNQEISSVGVVLFSTITGHFSEGVVALPDKYPIAPVNQLPDRGPKCVLATSDAAPGESASVYHR